MGGGIHTSRPPRENPVTVPMPESKITTPAVLSSSFAMSVGVGVRSNHSFFFSREKNEANGAPRPDAGSLDCAAHRRPGRHCSRCRARPCRIPRIEVRAEDDELVRLLAAAKLGNHVGGGDRATDYWGSTGPRRAFGRKPAGAPCVPSSRATRTMGRRSISPSPALVWR